MSKLFGFVFATCLLAIWTLTAAPAANPDWPKSLTLGTASPGGVYYIYGDGVARILTENLGITVNALPTQGPVHNVQLVESGGAQLGLITMGVGLQGWNGTGDWTEGKHFRTMRALFPMYDTVLQIVVLKRSGRSTVKELDKLRIGVGPRAGTGGVYVPEIMKALGVSPQIQYGSFADAASELLAAQYDALALLTGIPVEVFQEAEAKEPISFINLSAEQIETVRRAIPEFTPSKIKAGTYSTLDKDYATLGVYNFAIGRADLPNDLVYQLVKAIHENQPRLAQIHSAARETLPENALKNTFLPFHPGAIRYYREIGIKIPDALVPTN